MKKLVSGLAGLLLLTIGVVAVVTSQQPDQRHPAPRPWRPQVDWNPTSPTSDLPELELWTELADPVNTFSSLRLERGLVRLGGNSMSARRMDLTEVAPGSVTHHLTFIEPFWPRPTRIQWVESGEGLEVTWTYDADNDFHTMSLFMHMDALLGPDYVKGLANLKRNVERDAGSEEKARRASVRAAAAETGAETEAGDDPARARPTTRGW